MATARIYVEWRPVIALESRDIKTAPRATNSGATATKGCGPLSRTQDIPKGFCQCGCGGTTRLAPHSNRSKGWVGGEPTRFIRGHNGRKSPVEFVMEDCGHETPCWVWQRFVTPNGYGQAWRDGRTVKAHRAYFEEANGPIPVGMVIDHLCRNTRCVNPSHLEATTQSENVRRGYERAANAPAARDTEKAVQS